MALQGPFFLDVKDLLLNFFLLEDESFMLLISSIMLLSLSSFDAGDVIVIEPADESEMLAPGEAPSGDELSRKGKDLPAGDSISLLAAEPSSSKEKRSFFSGVPGEERSFCSTFAYEKM